MFSLNYYKGFSVFRSFSLEETATLICNMAYKLEKENSILTRNKINHISKILQLEKRFQKIKSKNEDLRKFIVRNYRIGSDDIKKIINSN